VEIDFNFYDIVARLSTSDNSFFGALEELGEDFSYFRSKDALPPTIVITIKAFTPIPGSGRGWFFFKNKAASVYGWGSERIADYGNNAWMRSSQKSEIEPRYFQIFCSNPEDARELAYLTILSAVGETLDRKDCHRVHALGIEVNGKSGIISLPSGGGKSSMAVLFSRNPKFKLFSDETPLVSKNQLLPFPVRMALRPEVASFLNLPENARVFKRRRYAEKILYPIPTEKVAKSSRLSFIIVGGTFNRENPAIRPCSKPRVFMTLMSSMVLGLGVAQISELMLRADFVLPLIRIAFSRLFAALRISLSSQCFVFELSRDPNANADALERFFTAQSDN
jgi:hypothetical protein